MNLYALINGRWVAHDVLRSCPPAQIAAEVGLTVPQLREWARGPGRPLGLEWRDHLEGSE